jgi:DNA-binding MarR family transcriptional regulator
MKTIENELKTDFYSSVQKAHLNILFTASVLKNYFSKRLRPFDLSLEQYNVLRIVRGAAANKTCVKQISMRMIERNSNTTRIIDKLVSKNLVFRQKSTQDKREQTINLTPEGISLLNAIDKDFELHPLHVSCLAHDEAEQLSRLTDSLRATIPTT